MPRITMESEVWTNTEDEILKTAVMKYGKFQWPPKVHQKSAKQCKSRCDQAERDGKDDDIAEDPHILKPGETDHNYEPKSTRPDPKNMNKNDMKMLSKARERLANTQGKKNKKKAHEKQFEKADGLATVQKRHELRIGGIQLETQKRKKCAINYSAEARFVKIPNPKLYDSSDEDYDPMNSDNKRLRKRQSAKEN